MHFPSNTRESRPAQRAKPTDSADGSASPVETVSPEGTFCDTVQVPSGAADMQLIASSMVSH